MAITLREPGVDELGELVGVLRAWQHDGGPMQLHPGDIGWFWRFGAPATAAAVRVWSRAGSTLALGLLDGPRLVRLAIAPEAQREAELAQRLAEDLTDPAGGVLGAGRADVEAPRGALLRERLAESGWQPGEAWTPLRRSLAEPVEPHGARIEVVGPDWVPARTAVQRAAFARSTFTDERWHTMAGGPPYAEARCMVAVDQQGDALAAATAWSAGPGRPGLLEPMGVPPEHRGHGYGRAITLAAAAALRDLGSSSVIVCTPSANVGAVATYRAAGFQPLPEVPDLSRPA